MSSSSTIFNMQKVDSAESVSMATLANSLESLSEDSAGNTESAISLSQISTLSHQRSSTYTALLSPWPRILNRHIAKRFFSSHPGTKGNNNSRLPTALMAKIIGKADTGPLILQRLSPGRLTQQRSMGTLSLLSEISARLVPKTLKFRAPSLLDNLKDHLTTNQETEEMSGNAETSTAEASNAEEQEIVPAQLSLRKEAEDEPWPKRTGILKHGNTDTFDRWVANHRRMIEMMEIEKYDLERLLEVKDWTEKEKDDLPPIMRLLSKECRFRKEKVLLEMEANVQKSEKAQEGDTKFRRRFDTLLAYHDTVRQLKRLLAAAEARPMSIRLSPSETQIVLENTAMEQEEMTGEVTPEFLLKIQAKGDTRTNGRAILLKLQCQKIDMARQQDVLNPECRHNDPQEQHTPWSKRKDSSKIRRKGVPRPGETSPFDVRIMRRSRVLAPEPSWKINRVFQKSHLAREKRIYQGKCGVTKIRSLVHDGNGVPGDDWDKRVVVHTWMNRDDCPSCAGACKLFKVRLQPTMPKA